MKQDTPGGIGEAERLADGCAEGVSPSDRGQDARDTTIGRLTFAAAIQS